MDFSTPPNNIETLRLTFIAATLVLTVAQAINSGTLHLTREDDLLINRPGVLRTRTPTLSLLLRDGILYFLVINVRSNTLLVYTLNSRGTQINLLVNVLFIGLAPSSMKDWFLP
jgi:hypothetical protein